MLAQSILSIALLACGTLAAPTPDVPSTINDLSLDKRAADWKTGKCEASISVNIPAAPFRNPDLYWTVNIIDNPGAQIGHWEAKNALEKDRQIFTSKGPLFYIRGQPEHTKDSPNALTLYYGSQQWNSQDCFKYTKFDKYNVHGYDYRHEYLCQFEC